MGGLTAVVLWGAVGLAGAGLGWRVARYLRTPLPNPIPLAPAPRTRLGVAGRVLSEALVFRSLLRADRWTWALGWAFHVSLALVLVRHLWLVTDPVWGWVRWLVPLGPWLSGCLVASLAGLLVRRLAVARIRYVSAPADYLWLALLIGLALSGGLLGYAYPPDLAAVRAFTLAWARLHLAPLPADPLLLAHLGLAAVLIASFPFGKLLHAPGVFLSPTLAARERGGSASRHG